MGACGLTFYLRHKLGRNSRVQVHLSAILWEEGVLVLCQLVKTLYQLCKQGERGARKGASFESWQDNLERGRLKGCKMKENEDKGTDKGVLLA